MTMPEQPTTPKNKLYPVLEVEYYAFNFDGHDALELELEPVPQYVIRDRGRDLAYRLQSGRIADVTDVLGGMGLLARADAIDLLQRRAE